MMDKKYVIIEDEKIAARRLEKLVSAHRANYQLLGVFDSVESACMTLPALSFDLMFMDIQLADGMSFEIFDQVTVDKPVIFTTAYDEYAFKAFKQNAVDYLLKPIDESDLAHAIKKFESHYIPVLDASLLLQQVRDGKKKERFVVKIGDHLKFIQVDDIQLIYSRDRATYLFSKEGRSYLVDYNMDQMVDLLDSNAFYRVSRKHIVNIEYLNDIVVFTNSRLRIIIDKYDGEDVIVSRERVAAFKEWIDQ